MSTGIQEMTKTTGGGPSGNLPAVIEQPMNANQSLVRGGVNPPLTMNELKFFGQMINEAGLIPKSPNETTRQLEARAMAKIIAGHSYGFDAVLSMRTFDIINGKLQPTSECVSILIKRSGRYNYKVVEWTNDKCDLLFVGKASDGTWKPLGHSIFTMDDAKRAGYSTGLNKANWEKLPRNMLLARAITNGKRLFCADVMDPGGHFGQSGQEVAEAVDVPADLEFAEPEQLAEAIDVEVIETATDVIESKSADLMIAIGDLFSSKLGGDADEIAKALGGQDLSQMSLEGLEKLHGDLAAM